MPRELTESHKRAMARGRARAAERRERDHRNAIERYEAYCRRDARLFARFCAIREANGPNHPDTQAARLEWNDNTRTCPRMSELPDDKTWRRLTGRATPDDDR